MPSKRADHETTTWSLMRNDQQRNHALRSCYAVFGDRLIADYDEFGRMLHQKFVILNLLSAFRTAFPICIRRKPLREEKRDQWHTRDLFS